MILQQILGLFDTELDRLYQLREIVVGLGRPSVLSASTALMEIADKADSRGANGAAREAEPVRAAKTARAAKVARAVRSPRGTRTAKPAVRSALEASALGGTIPKGPVVVPAAQVRAHAAKPLVSPTVSAARAPVERGSLGSMIRALRLETP